MIGTTVSHYEILEPLGSGGMGEVYKARDTRLDRLVALKLLSPQRASVADRRRFTREAKAASALDHPNVCTLYDFGETADGRLFLAMAFCEGETLRDKIDRGPLPSAEAADIAAQVAAALAAAHERGIVHRDVKPGNIMVSPAGRVKLVDFGIARSADQSRLTRAGTVVGTASYMAPEQFRGEPADHRADIWSLGVVLYEMLAGETPFEGRDHNELIQALLHRPPRPIHAFVSGVPPALQRIVARALAKEPADRYAHVGEMRWALETALDETDGAGAGGETVVDLPRRAARPAGEERTAPWPAAATLTGTTISRYEVLEPIGGGGMGVVYKALDTRLGRTVALKFLPPELTRDPDAKERFLLEARAASALDHPNVCTIHEIGETDENQLYLAMACYDGETLRRRIEHEPLSLDEATDIAKQVAQGLAKAHRQGIVHRDVKPANVMLTGDGVVKILDFGLAKLAGTAALTRMGTSLGTPAYMAPEQARGEEVDARADVWSLGVMLYEMIAGRRPFPGDNDQAVLYALLNEPPKPLSTLRVDVPHELERIVSRMLAKDPMERYPSMAEVIADLRKLRNEPSTGTLQMQAVAAPVRKSKGRRLSVVVAAAVVAVLAVAAWWLLTRRPAVDGGPVQATFSRLTDQEGSESFPSLSPDGNFFVYTKTVEGDTDVYWQRVGGGNPINLTADSEVADSQPALSPDGEQIAFRSEREGGGIFLMGATGESVRRLTDFGFNPAWSPDGKQLVVATEGISSPGARSTTSQLWKVDIASGNRSLLVEGDAAQPSWSPNGHRIAYWGVPPGSAQRVLWSVPAAGGEPVRITDDPHLNWSPVWSPDARHLYFSSDRGGTMNLWRMPVDERSGEARGEPEPITTPAPWSGLLSFSKNGKQIVYATDEGKSNLERIAFDPAGATVSGEPRAVTQGSRAVRIGEVSPDGQRIAFQTSAPREDLFVVQTDGGGLRQLTDDDFKDRVPRWSPDGSRILFYSNRSGRYEAWTIRPDGSGLEQLTRTTGEPLFSPIWWPDGKRIVCTRGFEGAVLVDLTQPIERRVPTPLPVDRKAAFNASSWSPDGKRLAGNLETLGIVVYSPESRAIERLSDRGLSPVWLRDNRTILYLDAGKVFALDSRTRKTWPVLAPPSNSILLGLSVSPDHRTLYTVRAFDEGDIWMATIR